VNKGNRFKVLGRIILKTKEKYISGANRKEQRNNAILNKNFKTEKEN
jgi:hypothetical protein